MSEEKKVPLPTPKPFTPPPAPNQLPDKGKGQVPKYDNPPPPPPREKK